MQTAQTVYNMFIIMLTIIAFADLFTKMQASVNGTNGFCLQASLQFQMVSQPVCKDKNIDYQNIYAILFALFFAEIKN